MSQLDLQGGFGQENALRTRETYSVRRRKRKRKFWRHKGIQRSFMFVGRKQLAQSVGVEHGCRVFDDVGVFQQNLIETTQLLCPKVPRAKFPCFCWKSMLWPLLVGVAHCEHPKASKHYQRLINYSFTDYSLSGCIIISHDEAKACCFLSSIVFNFSSRSSEH